MMTVDPKLWLNAITLCDEFLFVEGKSLDNVNGLLHESRLKSENEERRGSPPSLSDFI